MDWVVLHRGAANLFKGFNPCYHLFEDVSQNHCLATFTSILPPSLDTFIPRLFSKELQFDENGEFIVAEVYSRSVTVIQLLYCFCPQIVPARAISQWHQWLFIHIRALA